MIVGHRSHIAPGLWTIVLIVIWQSSAIAQQPATPPPQPPSASSTDPAEQIDQLLKKANDAVFVSGHLKEAEEESKQALELSQKLNDSQETRPRIGQPNLDRYRASLSGYRGSPTTTNPAQ